METQEQDAIDRLIKFATVWGEPCPFVVEALMKFLPMNERIDDAMCMEEPCPFVAAALDEFEDTHIKCSEHGVQKIVSSERHWGYAGPLYFYRLECGCQEVDASDDVPEM